VRGQQAAIDRDGVSPPAKGLCVMRRVVVVLAGFLTVLGVPALAQQAAPPAITPAAAAQAGLKVAFINLQLIANDSAEGKIATARVQALNQQKVNELNEKNKQLQANQQKLEQGGTLLSDAARAQLQKDIDRLTVEIERFQQDANSEVTDLQQQLQGDFQQKLMPVIEALVKAQGINVLFSITDAGVIYIDPGLDLTAEVVRRFDGAAGSAITPAPAAKPAAPGAAAPAKPAAPAPQKK
jgi:outer membrane protein